MLRRILFSLLVATAACKGKEATPAGQGSAKPAAGSAPATVASADAATTAPVTPAAPDAAAPAAAAGEPTGADGRPLYYPRALTDADLDGRSLRDLALMRNVVFARAGHTFRKAWLRDYFTAQPWYKPLPADDNSKITDVDRANVKLIAAREANFPHDQLVARQTELAAAAAPTEVEQVELRLLNEQLGSAAAGSAQAAAPRSPLEDPDQLDRLLTVDELADLSRRDLRILRNTVYARHGRAFRSEVLTQWFADKAWYKVDPDFTESMLTAIDKKNIKLIRSVEDSLGGPMSEHEHQAEDGWFEAA